MKRVLVLSFVFLSAFAWSQSGEASKAQASTSSGEAQDSVTANSKKDTPLPDSTRLELIKGNKAIYPLEASEGGIQGTVWLQLLISEEGDVKNVKVVSGDPALVSAAVDAARTWKFKPYIKDGKPTEVSVKAPIDFAFADKIMKDGSSADGAATSPVPTTLAVTGSRHTRVRVSQGVSRGLLVHQVSPVYPVSARSNHVQGNVVMQAVIGTDGRIHELRVISGPSELVPAATGAVEQWRYKPFLFEGEPVEVETQITVNFTLRY